MKGKNGAVLATIHLNDSKTGLPCYHAHRIAVVGTQRAIPISKTVNPAKWEVPNGGHGGRPCRLSVESDCSVLVLFGAELGMPDNMSSFPSM